MIYFPVGEYHVKIVVKVSTEFTQFCEFLRGTNDGKTFYSALRFGGIDHNLSHTRDLVGSSLLGSSLLARKQNFESRGLRNGHFVKIDGLPLFSKKDEVVSRVAQLGGVKRSFWGEKRALVSFWGEKRALVIF